MALVQLSYVRSYFKPTFKPNLTDPCIDAQCLSNIVPTPVSHCREFLGQAWMKPEKATKAPHILLMTRRFNDVSHVLLSTYKNYVVRLKSLTMKTKSTRLSCAYIQSARNSQHTNYH